jgi:G:T-mismatch repair DNA endonuclease (very short patch repair protein)
VALSKMPAEFRERVVILTTTSNQETTFRRISGFALPWQSGADAELQRRVLLQQEQTRLRKLGDVPGAALVQARALLSSAPLMITVPVPVGVFQHDVSWFTPSAGFTPMPRPAHLFWDADLRKNGRRYDSHTKSNVRDRIVHALVVANATCSNDRSRCVLCAPHSPGCAAMRSTVFGDTARSAVCIEPPGDTLGRSHVYVAIVTGCVPVLVEGGHPAYPDGEPTWWPWRAAPEAPGGLPAAASPLRGLTLDYSAFSLLPDGGGSNDSDAAARLVSESASLAADAGRLSRMRAELARVAPLFVYASRRPRAGEPEDAFERLRETLARVLDFIQAS